MNQDSIFGASERSSDWNFSKEQEDLIFESVEKILSELPDELVEIFNEVSLNELNKRGLIVWSDSPEGHAIAQQLNGENNERV